MSDADRQDATSVQKNKAFFAENRGYAAKVAQLTTYRNIRRAIDGAIRGKRRMLDVGNGGVFDYTTSLVEEIVGVDLFLSEPDLFGLPANVTLRKGDALALEEPDASYDVVLSVAVFHHLVSTDVEGSLENVRRAVAESKRVLEPCGTHSR